MWKEQLVTLYCTVCHHYSTALAPAVQRLSNNYRPKFTDEELITIYLWGIMQRRFEVKQLYNYTKMHLLKWFPQLPSYQAFNRRLNELAPAFQQLAIILLDMQDMGDCISDVSIIDSMPIILAKQSRSSRAKVAPELCSKTYSASRKQWYYGMKLHAIGVARYKRIPVPSCLCISTASAHDLIVAKQMMDSPPSAIHRLFADKAYCDDAWKHALAQDGIHLCTPFKKTRGYIELFTSEDCISSFISSIRQPIESFFNWLNEKTNIQVASKVRSTKGLLTFIFGRIAAALFSTINLLYS
jgi:hypothetical protein